MLGRLISEGAVRAPLLEDRPQLGERAGRLRGAALTGFVDLKQADALRASPPAHIVDAILQSELQERELLLRPEQIGRCNAGDGMGLVFLAFSLADDSQSFETNADIVLMLESFRLFHAGYACAVALHPAPRPAHARESLRGIGFRPVGTGDDLWALETDWLNAAPYTPFVILRRSTPPRLRFSSGEKDLLLHAVLGYSDAEIAQALHVGVDTVKKRWRRVFERVEGDAELRRLLGPRKGTHESGRGPEKRGVIVQYLATHLQELRPYHVE